MHVTNRDFAGLFKSHHLLNSLIQKRLRNEPWCEEIQHLPEMGFLPHWHW